MDQQLMKPEISYLPEINNKKGNILHILKSTDAAFVGFGEAYFSEVHFNKIKGWKQHRKMTSNLVVPVGKVLFVVLDYSQNLIGEYVLGEENYGRLTVPPNCWLAFAGLGAGKNLILNVSNLEHDPSEQKNISLESTELNIHNVLSKYLI